MATVHDVSAQGRTRPKTEQKAGWPSAAEVRAQQRNTNAGLRTAQQHKEAVRLAEAQLCGAAVATKEYITTLGSITSTTGRSGVKTCLTESAGPTKQDSGGQTWTAFGDDGRTKHLQEVCPTLFTARVAVPRAGEHVFDATSIGTDDVDIATHSTDTNIADAMTANTECQLLSSVASSKHGLAIRSGQKGLTFANGLVEITYSGVGTGKMTAKWSRAYDGKTTRAH
ncbi:hypothetical protein ERJ75_000599900 [Trypanosoma vivax]|nr:hypothetical protein ERJ75_000599900 [Trypanosoma vivax]